MLRYSNQLQVYRAARAADPTPQRLRPRDGNHAWSKRLFCVRIEVPFGAKPGPSIPLAEGGPGIPETAPPPSLSRMWFRDRRLYYLRPAAHFMPQL